MSIHDIFDDASRVMTVISFATFIGILTWTYILRKEQDFASTAAIPFDDDEPGEDYV